jgi:hypothetical protein
MHMGDDADDVEESKNLSVHKLKWKGANHRIRRGTILDCAFNPVDLERSKERIELARIKEQEAEKVELQKQRLLERQQLEQAHWVEYYNKRSTVYLSTHC